MKGQPGEPLDEASNPFTLAAYLSRCVALSPGADAQPGGAGGAGRTGQPRPEGPLVAR